MTEELDRALGAYRREVRPTGGRRASLEAAVLGTVPAAAGGASVATTVVGVLVGAALAALAIAGVLAFLPAARPASAPAAAPSRSPAASALESPLPQPVEAVEAVELPPTAAEAATPVMPVSPDPGPSPRRARPRIAEDVPPTAVEDMRLLRDADRMLERSPARSLALLRTHANRYPDSPLSLERDALRVVALCATGKTEQGSAAKARFLAAHAESPYERRVRGACLAGE